MIKLESVVIGILISIIITQCFGYYIFESELWSSLFYIVVFSFLYGMVTNKKIKETVLEGYTSTSDKNIEFEETDSFKGKRDGYVFKKDEKGLGYYLDK